MVVASISSTKASTSNVRFSFRKRNNGCPSTTASPDSIKSWSTKPSAAERRIVSSANCTTAGADLVGGAFKTQNNAATNKAAQAQLIIARLRLIGFFASSLKCILYCFINGKPNHSTTPNAPKINPAPLNITLAPMIKPTLIEIFQKKAIEP